MTSVAARELRNNSADLIERARNGEEITITVNGVPSARLIALSVAKKAYLTKDELLALRPKPGGPEGESWKHEFDGDITDSLGPIQ
ncbi:MAG: type II toxin-antitoxin system prevent-host-death family antitoxin [Microbacteriaceae bacterium]|nr:type II toxin-antitoxin system prevent-host-death family antitoxin [Microbacteriaceae bacterium]